MLDDFLLFSFSFFSLPSPRTTRHHRSIIVHFRFASFSIRAPVSGTWPNNAWRTSQRKIERAGGNENYRASRPGLTGPWCVQRSTRLAVRRRGEKARYHWNTLERKKERGGPRERTSGAHRGKLICAQPLFFQPLPRHKRKNRHRYASGCEPSRRAPPFFFPPPLRVSLFFLSFFLSFTKDKFGTVNMCHVLLQVTGWEKGNIYLCLCEGNEKNSEWVT